MLTSAEIRKNNLLVLVSKEPERPQKSQFAKRINMSESYLSQLIGPKSAKALGARLARSIEKKLNLPRGWMDQEHAQMALDNIVGLAGLNMEANLKVVRFIEGLSEEQRRYLEAMIKAIQPATKPSQKN